MTTPDQSGRLDPSLLTEALKRRLSKPDHPFPAIKGCENDRLVCAMAVVVLSPFLIKQINSSKLSVSGLIRDLGQRMRKFICQQGAELADWVNQHIANGNTDTEVIKVLIILEKIAPTIIPLYFTSGGNHLRRFGKKMFTLNDQEYEGVVFRRDSVKMRFDEEVNQWVADSNSIDDTTWLFNDLPNDVEGDLYRRRSDFDSFFGKAEVSGEWSALPSTSPKGDMPLVLSNQDDTVDVPSSELDSLYIEEDRGSDGNVNPVDVTNTDLDEFFGEEKNEDSLEEVTPEEREAVLEAARKDDEPIDPQIAAAIQARLDEEVKEQKRRAAEHKRNRDFEEGPGPILKELAASGVDTGASSAWIRRTTDEGVVEEPLNLGRSPQTIDQAIAGLVPEEEEDPDASGSKTQVIIPDDQNFETLTREPDPRKITRDMGTKGKSPALEEEGDKSDPSLLEEEEQADPSTVGGEDPVRAQTRTSIGMDISNKQPKKEDKMSETKNPEPMLEARRIELDETGNIVNRDETLVKHPLSAWTDASTGSFKLLGVDPNRCQFRASDGKVEKFLDLIALTEDPDTFYEHPLASKSNPDLMLASQAPGSGNDEQGSYNLDDDDWDEDFDLEGAPKDNAQAEYQVAAASFLGGSDDEDNDIELDMSQFDMGETAGQQDDGSSEDTPALPGIPADPTATPFEGNKGEDLVDPNQTNENNDNTSNGSETEDNPPKKETDMSDAPPSHAILEIIFIKVVKHDQDGTLTPDFEVNKNLVRSPHDLTDGATLNEGGTEFTFADGESGARAALVDDEGNLVEGVSIFAPNAESTRDMLEAQATGGASNDDHVPPSMRERVKAKFGAARDWAWSNQDNTQRALRTGLPVLLLLVLAGLGIWKYNQTPTNQLAVEQNWLPTRGSQELAKGYRELESHEGLRADLVFPWPGEEHKGALTDQNIKQVVRLMPQYDQNWRDDLRGFHLAYTVDDTFCHEIAGRYGTDHPIWRMGLPMAQFTVLKNVPHQGTAPANLISIEPGLAKGDRIAVAQYVITVSPAYQLELDKAWAISPQAYDRALPRVLYSRYHAPLPPPRISGN